MKLTSTQQKAILLLASSPLSQKFYWTGGTLLSYRYLHHRCSLYLDLFSEKPFTFAEINPFIQDLKKNGGFKKVTYQKIFDRWEFLLENGENLRIEFVYYNHEKKTLKKRERVLGVNIDSLEDIAANKTLSFFDRNEPKDLFDLYFLLEKAKFTPKRLLALAKDKFDISFSKDLFWSEAFKALPLLKEIKPLMIQKTDREKEELLGRIEEYFKNKSKRFLTTLIL